MQARQASSPRWTPDDLVHRAMCTSVASFMTPGLGGNQQKGISYPAGGTYVLLFSDPNSTHDLGIQRQSPLGGYDAYRYYGEWSGTGDMISNGGNLAIVERSPEIHLFVRVAGGHRFAGRFTCVRQARTPATRDGKEYSALVFTLERAPSRQN